MTKQPKAGAKQSGNKLSRSPKICSPIADARKLATATLTPLKNAYLMLFVKHFYLTDALEESISHDQINRYLRRKKLTPRLVWEQVKLLIQSDENAYIIFDDTVLDKRYSEEIELTRRQYPSSVTLRNTK